MSNIIDDLRKTYEPGMRQHEREARIVLSNILEKAAVTIEASHAASAAKDAEIARLTGERGDYRAAAKRHRDEVQRLLFEVIEPLKARAERAEAALAESEASKGALIERIATMTRPSGTFLSRGTVGLPYGWADTIRAIDPDATVALAAYVKQHVEAETRACAEIVRERRQGWLRPYILARLDQTAGGGVRDERADSDRQ